MTVRPIFLAAVPFTLLLSLSTALISAQEAPAPADIEVAKQNYIGVVIGNSVFVRSAPREDAYPTTRLDKGAEVTVVGLKSNWLKILPPPGSFAYVQKAFVNKRGEGKVGRATREMIAKAGSNMNQLKTAPMGKIEEGQDVEILGEQDDWYKITPPQGSFLYINRSYVNSVRPIVTPKPNPVVDATPPADAPGNPAQPAPATDTPPTVTQTPAPGAPGSAPAAPPAATAVSFEKLEADFAGLSAMAIGDQPVEVLLAGYTEVLKQDGLTSQNRQVAEVRIATLKLRAQSKAEFVTHQQELQLAAARQQAMVAEHGEIQQRINEKQVTMYAVVGTLRVSSIQHGGGTLFRLTDPASGRTIAYVRTLDSKYGPLLGQFVGVKGVISTDTALGIKIIEQPTQIDAVDPSTVNNTVMAQLIPPSMISGAPAPASHTAD